MKEYIVRMIAYCGGVMCGNIVTACDENEAVTVFKKNNPTFVADCSPSCERYEVIEYK